jgi:hypothetical protein
MWNMGENGGVYFLDVVGGNKSLIIYYSIFTL